MRPADQGAAGMAATDGPLVPVLPKQEIRAWPGHEDGGLARYTPLSVALAATHKTDAHFAAYSVPEKRRRLDTGALRNETARAQLGDGVPMVAVVYDVDFPDAHDGVAADGAIDVWWVEEVEKLSALLDAHPGGYVYRTRGGYRIVYILESPITLSTRDDERAWSARYCAWIEYLRRVFGILADPACKDWTRLYRLPHATRDNGPHPERLQTIGDVDGIGAWVCTPSPEDEAVGREMSPERAAPPPSDRPAVVAPDESLLVKLFAARGWLGDAAKGGWLAVCDNAAAHTKGEDFDGSTILYPASNGNTVGWLDCLHAHCRHRKPADVLRSFTRAEIDAASPPKTQDVPRAPADEGWCPDESGPEDVPLPPVEAPAGGQTATESDAIRGVADFARTLASSQKPGGLAVLERHVAGLRASFGAKTDAGGWGWADPSALLAEPEEPIRWYVQDFLAPGHVTSLNASPKCGKTTTVTRGIVGPLSRGEAPFCGTVPEEPVLTLWLTEESRRGARNHVKYGGIRAGAVLPRPGPPASVPWPSVVEGAADHARKIGARVLVFDTFARHARLKGDEENSASAVGEAMEPVLRVAATHDLAVLLIHHVKKWAARSTHGGDVDLARGSGAFNANVDFYANLIKPEGRKPGQERYRELYGAGRDGVEDYKLTLDLMRGDGVTTFDRFRVVAADEVARDDALDADIVDLVRASGESGTTKAEIIDQVERRNSDVVASLTRLSKGAPPKIRKGRPAKGEKAPRFRLWEGAAS